jgi:hypothetical protein
LLEIDIVLQVLLDVRGAPEKRPLFGSAASFSPAEWATYLQDHPPQHVLPSQSPMRLGGFPQRIACRDRHTNPPVCQVPIQLLELPRTRDHVEGLHAERASLRGHRLDAVRVHDASAGPYEVETPLEAIAPGEREHAI